MRAVYERRVGFRDQAREIDEDGGLRDRANQIDDENARRRRFSTGAADRTVELDGTGTHASMPDDGVPPLNNGGGKTLVGSFPPGDYVTMTTASGFHVYKMDPVRADLGVTYDRAPSGAEFGFKAAADIRRGVDRVAAINAMNAAFWARGGR